MASLHTNTGAKRAREARTAWGLDDASPVPCIVTLAEARAGLPVIVAALPEDVAGALWRNGIGAILWVNGHDNSVPRQRFTVAHELGHERCGHEHPKVDRYATMYGKHDPNEVQANAFAAELLMPRAGVEAMVEDEPGLEAVVRVAAHFGTSTIAALYRLNTLGLASARRSETLSGEIGEKLHHDVWDYLAPEPIRDVLAEIDDLPRLPASLAGSGLAGLLRGEVSVGAVAGKTGCSAATLGAAAAALGR